MPEQYVVVHTQVSTAPKKTEEPVGRVFAEGELVEPGDFEDRAQFDRLVQLGAVRAATHDDVGLAASHAKINDALQAVPGPEAQAKADRRAEGEREIAERPARLEDGATVPAGTPVEAAPKAPAPGAPPPAKTPSAK